MKAFYFAGLVLLSISCTKNTHLIPKPTTNFEGSDSYNFSHRMRVEVKQNGQTASNGLVLKGKVDRKLLSADAFAKKISLDFYINDINWGLQVLEKSEKTQLLSALGRKFNVVFSIDGRLESVEFRETSSSFVRQVIYNLVTPMVFTEVFVMVAAARCPEQETEGKLCSEKLCMSFTTCMCSGTDTQISASPAS